MVRTFIIPLILSIIFFISSSFTNNNDVLTASGTIVGNNTSPVTPITNSTISQPTESSSAANVENNSPVADSGNNQIENNIIIPIPLIDIAPSQRIALAFTVSFITILLITFVVSITIRYARRSHPNIKGGFCNIIRGEDWYPSLAIFQFLVWTFIITFAFFGIYLVRIFGGVLEPPPSIPTNILALMGISVAVPIISGGVSRIKYNTSAAVKEPPPQLPPLSTMLEENKKPSLTRFQMFGWTWIGILIYIGILFSTVSTTLMDIQDARMCNQLHPNQVEYSQLHCDKPLRKLTLPDIDPTLVILMGLSQGGYLGGKIVTTPTIKIEKVVLGKKDNNTFILSIFGNNFGENKDTVWFDDTQIRDNSILSWNDSRIDASLGTINLVENTKHKIRVSRDSLIEEKMYTYKEKELIED